jgi:MoaA/NifB/PqqE/SkfB family radical SAM enzyme
MDKELSTEQIFSIIDELADNGTQRVSISGGEPLLREDIGEIISHIKKKGMGCGLNTNGLLVPDRIEEVRKVDSITISLDGEREAHEANRGRGTFEKVM